MRVHVINFYVINGMLLIDGAMALGDHIEDDDAGEDAWDAAAFTEQLNEMSKWYAI